MANSNTLYTSFSPQDRMNDFSALEYWFRKKAENINTFKLCRISKANEDGSYDAETLVNELNPYTNKAQAIRLQSLPVLRVQGDSAGFIVTYGPGDIVLVGFCDRDIQAVKRSKDFAAPGTNIQFPLSSGIILGAVLFNAPSVYVKASDKVYIKGDIDTDDKIRAGSITAGEITASEALEISGTLTVANTPGINGAFVDAGGTTHTVKNGIIVS